MMKNYKIKILVFLLILGILYGCKRQILDPVLSANTAIPSKHLDKAKNWFAKNKPNFHSTNARINIDSVRYKEFFPAWQFAKMHTLIAGDTLIVVPVQRNFNIEYTEIGFLRRLCLYIQHDTVRSAKIIELISDKALLKANEDFIFKSVETALNGGTISNLNIAILQYDLDYTHEEGKVFVDGTSKGDIALAMDNAKGDVIMIFTGENPWQGGYPGPTTLGSGAGTGSGSGGGGNGNGSGSINPVCGTGYQTIVVGTLPNQQVICVWINTTPSTIPIPPVNTPPPPLTPIPTIPVPPPSTNIPFPIGGGGSGSSSTTIFTPVASNPPLTPPDPNCMKGMGGGMGVSDETTTPRPSCPDVDNAENTEEVIIDEEEAAANAELRKLFKVYSGEVPGRGADKYQNLTKKEKISLVKTINDLKNLDPVYRKMFTELENQESRPYLLKFKLRDALGSYNKSGGLMTINNLSDGVIAEEFVHFYQYKVTYATRTATTMPPHANIEYEAKLIVNIIAKRNERKDTGDYAAFIEKSSSNTSSQGQAKRYLEDFIDYVALNPANTNIASFSSNFPFSTPGTGTFRICGGYYANLERFQQHAIAAYQGINWLHDSSHPDALFNLFKP